MSAREHIERLAQRLADGEPIDETLEPVACESAGLYKALKKISRVSRSFRGNLDRPDETPIELGSHWGHLRIDEPIGAGGMGEVFLAYDSVLDSHVAVKFLGHRARQFIDTDLFIAEARRMARVRHPNVLAVFGAGVFDQRPGFWSEYLEGRTLHQVINNHALSFKQVLRYALDLARALHAVHGAGLIHGDVKTLNVIVDANRGAVLMDFGAGIDVREGEGASMTRQVTPAIMSPEQVLGEPLSQSCDIYALGLLFYTLSTGELPFTRDDLRARQRDGKTDILIDFGKLKGPRRWKALVRSMLAHADHQRPDISTVESSLLALQGAPLRRAKGIALSSAAALLAGVTIATATAYYMVRAENEQTEKALLQAQAYNSLTNEILMSASPLSRGKDTPMLDVIRSVESRLQAGQYNGQLVDDALRLKALRTIAFTYSSLDDPERSLALARELRTQVTDADERVLLEVLIFRQLQRIGTPEQAAEQLTILTELVERLGADANSMGQYWSAKAQFHLLRGEWEAAQQAVDQGEAFASELLPNELAAMRMGRFQLLLHQSEFEQAIAVQEESLQALRRACSCRDTLNTLVIESQIAEAYLKMGRHERGVGLMRHASNKANEFLGEGHTTSVRIAFNLVASLNAIGEFEEVVRLLTANRAQLLEHPDVDSRWIDNNLANAYLSLEQYDKAEGLYQEIIGSSAPDSYIGLLASYNLAELYYKSERPHLTLELSRGSLPRAQRVLGEDHLISLELQDAMGWSLHLLGQHEASIEVLKPLLSKKRSLLGDGHPLTQSTETHLQAAQRAR